MEGGSVPVLLVTHEMKNHYPPAARAILPVEIAKLTLIYTYFDQGWVFMLIENVGG